MLLGYSILPPSRLLLHRCRQREVVQRDVVQRGVIQREVDLGFASLKEGGKKTTGAGQTIAIPGTDKQVMSNMTVAMMTVSAVG